MTLKELRTLAETSAAEGRQAKVPPGELLRLIEVVEAAVKHRTEEFEYDKSVRKALRSRNETHYAFLRSLGGFGEELPDLMVAP